MTKYIPRYYWPNGYIIREVGGVWSFSPVDYKPGYQRKIVLFVVYGKTIEEAESNAYKKLNNKPFKQPSPKAPKILKIKERIKITKEALGYGLNQKGKGTRLSLNSICLITGLSTREVQAALAMISKEGVLIVETDRGRKRYYLKKQSWYGSVKPSTIKARRVLVDLIRDKEDKKELANIAYLSEKTGMFYHQIKGHITPLLKNGLLELVKIGRLNYYKTGEKYNEP